MQKFIKLTFILALTITSLSISACSKDTFVDDKPIQASELPQKAQQFINTYFADCTVLRCEKDGHEYEVFFQNGFEVEFDRNGDWEDVDCKNSAVPQGIVPEAIVNYVTENYPTNFIVEISCDRHGYDVELNNGLELEFDKNGGFIRIDY